MASGLMDGFIASFAEKVGATVPAIRLFSSLLLGYPLAFIYRNFIFGKPSNVQHVFFALCGLWLCYFNFGFNVLHSIANIVVIYALLLAIGGTQLSVALAFIFNLGYLVAAYYFTATDGYDIRWTTPHCVLCLRLTGLVFDVYDGRKDRKSLSSDQQSTALDTVPSPLEVLGYSYHFGGFMTGPQFPLKRYRGFVEGAFGNKQTGGPPASIIPGMRRLSLGVVYIAVYQVGHQFFPGLYMVGDEFASLHLWQKLLYIGIWGKFALYKYIAVWMIVEGACILTGLTYNGTDQNGNDLWDGCINVKLVKFETATTFQEKIDSFNLNTNLWMLKYVYKRLRFLGHKEISQAVTLFTLAVWHGIHSGYYMNFALEFPIVNMEKDIQREVDRNPTLKRLCNHPLVYPVHWVFRKMFVEVFLGYPLIGFVLLTYERWYKIYSEVYWCGHILFFSWPLVYMLLKATVLKRPKAKVEKDAQMQQKLVDAKVEKTD
ncbi:lysophospholipid acyltransferase 5 [Lingula anatina]|uniref:Lysophospholipid acyltransferase 5 n=1 Tax=Lingula anatina TaxID=7574 RepID=A0A1S3HZI8_LINAN|nr:lysophospholipid acyltransferase 5 [Lingula anatina]|eukprot:XP_013391427.1 lysophospholipid acyltransferase 5 [Lingula anatina]